MNDAFSQWIQQKDDLHENKMRVYFHEREIWFAALGKNIGSEQDGPGIKFLRPVVVVKKFNNEILWGIPLTKTKKTGEYHFSFNFLAKTSCIKAQLRQLLA